MITGTGPAVLAVHGGGEQIGLHPDYASLAQLDEELTTKAYLREGLVWEWVELSEAESRMWGAVADYMEFNPVGGA